MVPLPLTAPALSLGAPALAAIGGLLPLLALVPLGMLAGVLSGLLGIGGGLVFSPLLLLLGLPAHQALATSTVAIVLTTCGGTLAHLRAGALPRNPSLALAAGAALSGLLMARLGVALAGWQLLALQALMYVSLSITIRPRDGRDRPHQRVPRRPQLAGLAATGCIAGAASGLLGVGGGLVMVPVMVRVLQVPIHLAIRLSTLAVLVSATAAAPTVLGDGRGQLEVALVLGAAAALTARWAAARLQRVEGATLAWMLRGLSLLLAADSGRRALGLLLP